MKPMEFLSRWKQGMKEITPIQQMHSKMVGHAGTSIGMTLAFGGMVYRIIIGFSWFQLGITIFIFFIAWLQIHEYRSARQKYKGMKEMMKQIEGVKEVKK